MNAKNMKIAKVHYFVAAMVVQTNVLLVSGEINFNHVVFLILIKLVLTFIT